jgi:hypothetical protein
MQFEQIEVGSVYEVDFDDPNYPCDCACHTDKNILHCEPCCDDRSYQGQGMCIGKDEASSFVAVSINKNRFLVVRPISIIKLCVESAKEFEIDEYQIKYARTILRYGAPV